MNSFISKFLFVFSVCVPALDKTGYSINLTNSVIQKSASKEMLSSKDKQKTSPLYWIDAMEPTVRYDKPGKSRGAGESDIKKILLFLRLQMHCGRGYQKLMIR